MELIQQIEEWQRQADARETLDETDPKIADARECAGNMLVWCAHEALKTPQHALSLLPFEALARELRRRGATVTPAPHGGDFDGHNAEVTGVPGFSGTSG